MSTTLYWEPVVKCRHASLCDGLKYILAGRYWDHDGSLHGEDTYLTATDLSYLCGIRDGSRDKDVIKGINILLEAIEKYGCVKIWLE